MASLLAEAVAYVEEAAAAQPLTLRLRPARALTDDEFVGLCRRNPGLRVEQSAEGELLLMPPTGGETGNRNFGLAVQFGVWAWRDGTGKGFDSSTLFVLPGGARRSPDLSWVTNARLAALTAEQKRGPLPLCPDFVVELRSASDSLAELQAKMEEYRAGGARLGWLLDPPARRVYVYRPGQPVQEVADPATLAGDPELPGFVLDLAEIWTPNL